MSAIDKAYSLEATSHGFDDISVLQAGGTINSVAKYGAGKWTKYAMVTASAAHNLTRGEGIFIMGTTDYDGPTRVVAIVNATQFVIRRPFTITKTGTWDKRGAEVNFDAFRIMNGDLAGSSVTFVYWKPEQQGGLDGNSSFAKDLITYTIPGGIKSMVLSTAGTSPTAPTVRLIRGSSSRFGALRNPEAAVVIGYNPTGATAGATVDILGKNFDPTADNNVVLFSNGLLFVKVIAADQEGGVLTVVLPTGVITGPVTVKSRGLATSTGPTFNIN